MAETSSGSQTVSDMLEITIKTLQRGAFPLQVSRDATVSQMKELLQPRSEIPASRQRLIFKGRVLRDEQTLQEVGIESGNALHLVERPADAPPSTGAGQGDAGNRPGMQSIPGLGPTGNMQDFGRFLSGVLGSLTGAIPTVPTGTQGTRAPFGATAQGGAQQPQQRENMHLLQAINTFLNTISDASQPPPPIPITSLHPRFQEGGTQHYRWLSSALRTLLENAELHPDLQSMLQQAIRELEANPPPPPATSSGTAAASTTPAATGPAASPAAPPPVPATAGTAATPAATPAAGGGAEAPSAQGSGPSGPSAPGEPGQPGRQGLRRPPPPPYPYAPLIIPAIVNLVQRAQDYTTGPLSQNLQADIEYLRGVHSLEGNRQEVTSRMRDLTGRLHVGAALLTELARVSAAACLAIDGNPAALAFNSAAVLTPDGTMPSFPRLLPRSDTPHIADAFIVRGDIDPSQLPPGVAPFPPGMFMMPPMPGASPGAIPGGPTPTPADGSGAQTPAGNGSTPPVPEMGQGAASARFGPFVTPAGTAFGGISIQGDGPIDLGQQIMNMFSSMPGAQVMQGPTTTTIAVTSAQFGEPDDAMQAGTAPGQGAAAAPTAGAGGMPAAGMPDLSNLNLQDLQFPDMGAIRIDMADVSIPQLLQQFQGMMGGMGGNFMNQPPQDASRQQDGTDGNASSRSGGGAFDPRRGEMSGILQSLAPVIQNIVHSVVASISNHVAASSGSTSSSGPAATSATEAAGAVPATPELRSAVTDAVSTGLEVVLSTISRNLDSIESGLRQVERRTGQEAEFMDVMRQIASVLASSFPSRAASASATGTVPTSAAPRPSSAPPSTTAPEPAGTETTAAASTAQEPREGGQAAAAAAGPSISGAGAAPSVPPRGLGGGLRATSAKRKPVSAAAKSAAAASAATAATPSTEQAPADETRSSGVESSSDVGGSDWDQLLQAANVMRSATGAGARSAGAEADAPSDGMASLFGGLASQLGSQQGGGAAGAGGGGLGNLFQMAGRIAADPAMRPMIEQAASQLFGGGQSDGGLGNLLGSLLGGGGASLRPTSQPRAYSRVPPNIASLANLDIRDAERWRDIMDADEAAQTSMPSQPAFSDAYLAGAPPKSKSLFKRNEGSSQN